MFGGRIKAASLGGPGSGPARGGRGPSLRGALLALILSLAGTLAGLAAVALWQAQAAAERQITEQLLGTARAMARVIDREFARAEALLQGFALFPSLRGGDLQGFIAEARTAAEALGMPILGVAGPEGRQLASSFASPARIAAGLPAAPEVMQVFETGRTSFGDFTEGNDPGWRRIVLGVPVRAEPGGEVRYALGIVLPRERLLAALLEQRLPEGWVATLIDREMTVVARTRIDDQVVGNVVPEPYAAQFRQGREGVLPQATSLDRESVVLAYARAPVTDFLVAIAVPEAVFDAARWGALRRLAWLVLPVVALALALAVLLASRLARALRRLAQPDATGAGLREVAELGAALAAERQARDAAEIALRERSVWLEAAQQAAQLGVWQQDLRAGRLLWSAGMFRLLGLPPQPEAMPPGNWLDHVHPEDRARVAAALQAQLRPDGAAFAEEFRVRAADGGLRWVRGQGAVERDAAGQPVRALGAWIDITARRALEEEREALLRQQEFLAREIHHRVKNSLQLVLSMLLLQARRAPREAAAPLRDAARRVATVAAVHRRLYEESPEAATDVGRYLAGLVADLRSSLTEASAGRDLVLVAEPGLHLAPERLAPLGIVATELMTNALKYGRGRVTLRLSRGTDGLELAVEDEGPGFPPGFEPGAARGLGMRVALALMRQCGGRLAVDRAAPGGRVVLTLPAEPEQTAGRPRSREA